MDTEHRTYKRAPFNRERCTQCGECFSQCPVLQFSEAKAKQAIKSLMECFFNRGAATKEAQQVLSRCTSCFSCNVRCPEDCLPANLILDLWHRQYKKEGLPERARYFLPHSVPNFRTYVLERLPADEQAAVESWKNLEPLEEMFYPGCNIISSPYLTFSKLFDGMPIRGALEYCCGEMYFRMGLYDQVEEVARKTTNYFQRLGVKRVYMLCTAGLNLFTHVLPQFGADFEGITFIPYLKVLFDRLAAGAWPIVKRFDGQVVTVQDSCHGKLYEPDFCEWPRKILRLLGFEIREAEYNRESAVCCGIGSGFSHAASYGMPDMIRGQRLCRKTAATPGADRIAAYCAGCLEMMSAARGVYWDRTPVYHVIELIQEALGETPRRRQGRVAFDFVKGTLFNQRHSRRRFFVPPLE